MGYTPENNPYIPGDPYSYDLAWMVQEVKAAQQVGQNAQQYANAALQSQIEAQQAKDLAMAWAIGEDDGGPIPPGEPQYENNAKYYAEQASTDAQTASDNASAAIQAANDAADLVDPLDSRMNTIEARMDTFTQLTVGSTTGDAELQDIRAAVNGVTYPTAGDAVRAQISFVDGEIDSSLNYEADLTAKVIKNSYITTSVAIGNTVDLTPVSNNAFVHIIVPCKPGSKFTITGGSGNAPRLWAFIDSDDKMLQFAGPSITGTDLALTAPAKTACAIFNMSSYSPYKVIFNNALMNVENYLDTYYSGIKEISFKTTQLFDKSKITENMAYSPDYLSIVTDSTKCLSDFIPISARTRLSMIACLGKAIFFDKDKNYISAITAAAYANKQSTTAPDAAAYVRLEMSRYYYPYAQTQLVVGDNILIENRAGSLANVDRIFNKQGYVFSDEEIPKIYSAIGLKPIDGSQDFDDDNPSVNQLYAAYDALVAAFPDYVTKVDFGMDASNTYPMYAYYFTPEAIPTQYDMFRHPYPKINLRSGIHGNGPSGDSNINLFCLYYLLKSLCYNWRESEALTYLRWNVRIAVLPLQNPWGFENKSRYNSNGVDINRNFSVGWEPNNNGGADPLDQIETEHIISFETANNDAVFSMDIHSQSAAPAQNQMVYNSLFVTSEMYYPAASLLKKMSHLWDSQNIPGLTPMNYHGYLATEFTGWGTGSSYITAQMLRPAVTVEGFKNFSGSSYSNGSIEIMQMVGDQLGYAILLGLEHFKH